MTAGPGSPGRTPSAYQPATPHSCGGSSVPSVSRPTDSRPVSTPIAGTTRRAGGATAGRADGSACAGPVGPSGIAGIPGDVAARVTGTGAELDEAGAVCSSGRAFAALQATPHAATAKLVRMMRSLAVVMPRRIAAVPA